MKVAVVLAIFVVASSASLCLQGTTVSDVRDVPCGTLVGQISVGERSFYRADVVTNCVDVDGQTYTYVPVEKHDGWVVSSALQVCPGACVTVNTASLDARSTPCGAVSTNIAGGSVRTVSNAQLAVADCQGQTYVWAQVTEGFVTADYLRGCTGVQAPTAPLGNPPPEAQQIGNKRATAAGSCRANRHPTATGVNGLRLIESFEGKRNCWYLDPIGLPTIGYGHLIVRGDPYHRGTCLSDAQVVSLLQRDLGSYERCVHSSITAPLNQNMFDALVSFTFNLGCGALQTSTLRRILNQGNYAGVCNQLRKWVMAGGRPLAGLVRRRNAECNLFHSCAGLKQPAAYVACPQADACSSCLLNSENDHVIGLYTTRPEFNASCSYDNWKAMANDWCTVTSPWECYYKIVGTKNITAQCPMCPAMAPPAINPLENQEAVPCVTYTGANLCANNTCSLLANNTMCNPATGNCVSSLDLESGVKVTWCPKDGDVQYDGASTSLLSLLVLFVCALLSLNV